MNDPRYPGLHGLVDQLPKQAWTAERRAVWLDAFEKVLDYSIGIRVVAPAEPDDELAPPDED